VAPSLLPPPAAAAGGEPPHHTTLNLPTLIPRQSAGELYCARPAKPVVPCHPLSGASTASLTALQPATTTMLPTPPPNPLLKSREMKS